MRKKNLIILGNGFTIDLLSHINMDNDIDVRNLFSAGDKVPWPHEKIPGYLSYKYTPNLWQIGVSSTLDSKKGVSLLEDIITTANMYTEIKKNNIDPKSLNIIRESRYIKAYRELVSYLKHLFIYYNSLVSDEKLKEDSIRDWGWYKYFKKLQDDEDIEEVIIVTYNYDIFLERIFKLNNIQFALDGLETENKKFKIVKPHGSISFSHECCLPMEMYKINYESIFPEAKLENFKLEYEDFYKNYLVDAIIPPAGNSNRINVEWADELRNRVLERVKNISFNDKVIVCGISYWHVDREEIDELLININPSVDMVMVNPSVPNTFSAVIETIFPNYILYSNSDILGGIY